MLSRFSALRALVAAASLCSSVLSIPTSPLSLATRSFSDYHDNLIYFDGDKSSLYAALSMGGDTYAACLDNKWGGIVTYGDKNSYSGTTQKIEIEEVSITVQDGRTSIGIFDEDIVLAYYHATSWSSLPKLGYSGVGTAYMGISVTDENGPISSYWQYKWPSDYSKWYYDIMITYDWQDAQKDKNVDFAGVIVVGETVDWTELLGISSSQVSQYGLPSLSGISSQPYIWLEDSGVFYTDNCFWVNGKQTTWKSEVPKTPSDKVVVDIHLTTRWSTFPDSVVKAIYGWVSGNKYYSQGAYGYYQIPCDTKITFVFEIDGYKYTVTEEVLVAPNPWGDQCIGSIFTPGQSVSAVPEYDIIFGFQFISAFYYRSGMDHDKNQWYYKLLPLPAPTGGWDDSKYYTAPSYVYSSWKPTWTTTYGGSGNSNYGDVNGGYYGSSTTSSYKGKVTTTSSYYQPKTTHSTTTWYQPPHSTATSSYQPVYDTDSNQFKTTWQHTSTTWYNKDTTTWYTKPTTTQYAKPTTTWYTKPTTTSSYGYKDGEGKSTWTHTQTWHNKDTTTQYTKPTATSTYGHSDGEGKNTWTHSPTWYNKDTTTWTTKPMVTTTSSYGSYNGGYNGGYNGHTWGTGNNGGYSSATYGSYGSSWNSGSTYDDKVAGNLATEGGVDESGTNWKDKAKLYEIIIIVLGCVLGLGIIGAVVAFIVGRRNKETARPSAYRSIHEAESSEPKAPLYGAEGGSSRYEDPYADKA